MARSKLFFFSAGMNTLIGKSLDFVEIRINCDNEGQFILLYCKIYDHPILFMNNYAPIVEKEQIPFFENVSHLIRLYGISKSLPL